VHSPVTIPNVIDTTATYAVQKLASVGLDYVSEEKYNIKVPPNEVVWTIPYAGTKVLAGSPVTVIISLGTGACVLCSSAELSRLSRTMPNVCGMTFQAANILLLPQDITVNPVPIIAPSAKPAGEIIGSVPPANKSFVAYGSKAAQQVVLTISSGHTTSGASPPPADARSTC
jgi:beta-lactam-binding protein with PASTA domain